MFTPNLAHRHPAMLRIAALAITLCTAGPALAEGGAFYRATLEKPAAQSSVISNDVLWHGQGNVLEASEVGDIAKRVCAVLAQQVGPVTEFSAGGKALAAEDLAFCNKHAKKVK